MANPLHDTLFGRHEGSDTVFLILPDGTRITHDAFLARAARFARTLADLGVVPGDRVAAQVDKSSDALALYAACVRSGAVFLPLNTAYTADEIAYFLTDSAARVFACSPKRAAEMAPVATAAGAHLETLGDDGTGTFAARADRVPADFPTAPRDRGDLAALLYTSGTTGRPKGAMLTQDNLLSNAKVLADAWRFTEGDVLLHALPIFHTHGLFVATNVTLAAGGAMVLLPRFDLDAILEWMPQATTMMGVPKFYTRLLDDARFTRDVAGHMRLFISGSAPLLAETHRQFEARIGHRILERYGMTETNMSTSNPHDGERIAGTVGMPLPGVELKITDPETGAEVPNGEIGVIEVRGPNVFAGYWQMPEKTREELRENGFFITGDLARIDDKGYVTIAGRAKDLIISGGLNVYPKEIEQVIDDQPGVLESAVIGVPHPDFGESPVALIVPEPGAAPDLHAIEAELARRLARFKQPRHMETVEVLPRNTMGKVQKAALRQGYSGLFSRS